MKRIALHIAFWLAYLVQNVLLIYLLNTTRTHLAATQNLLLSVENGLVILIPKLLFTYFILYVTLQKMAGKATRKVGVLYSLLALIMSVLLYRALAVFFIEPVIYGWINTSTSFFYPLAFPVALMDIGFASGIAIVIKQLRQQLALAKRQEMLVKEKLETELKYLRNQTNPHFLFNTLNNIYALARKKSDDTPEVVMKLSKLLRFMLYETARPLISIEQEIKMLEDYIDLERIRYSDKLSISFSKEISDEQASISPLLLLPFVENAFKHGAGESRFASFIDINMKLNDGLLFFTVKNTKEDSGHKEGNIGLNNVKRQLELLYKEYELQVKNEASLFIIALKINLSTYAKNELYHR